MAFDPWYRVAQPREEVREGRSFNPDEFAIALEQVVGGTAPADYRDPEAFFARTCFTRALSEHAHGAAASGGGDGETPGSPGYGQQRRCSTTRKQRREGTSPRPTARCVAPGEMEKTVDVVDVTILDDESTRARRR